MIDLLHLPEPDERTVWFPGQGASADTTGWRVWTKPRGVSMVSILAIGSGGGGGGGAYGSLSARGGAPGGGAPVSRMVWPAWALPDRLYVLSVSGGAGGAGGTFSVAAGNGSNGGASMVSVYPNNATGNLIITTANGGRGGLASGSTQAALTAPGATSAALGQMAASQRFTAGTATGLGYSTSATNVTLANVINPGAGGAGYSGATGYTGAGYNAISGSLMVAVPGGTANTGNQASSGFILDGIHYGGCGGGGSYLLAGGPGGNGVAWGAGGGGGGGGFNPGGGRGGDGGPGLVIIASW